jgi:signal transduction histidine kinase
LGRSNTFRCPAGKERGVADARDRETGGTGLGLAITERAVKLHGGKITAINADGGGLEIEMLLPIRNSQTEKHS